MTSMGDLEAAVQAGLVVRRRGLDGRDGYWLTLRGIEWVRGVGVVPRVGTPEDARRVLANLVAAGYLTPFTGPGSQEGFLLAAPLAPPRPLPGQERP